MRVNLVTETLSVTGLLAQLTSRPARLGQDKLAVSRADSLSKAFEQTPVSRPDAVARASQLVLDVSYRPEILIRKLSALLAQPMAS